ncbi:YafY family protein [Herbaspirillum sp. meg3]|uniref:helix-turn-helix transcriptional regulator n=1 Tax=Herbaspirillum sp. meg3 TaxID=2025949 RepID=UPI0012FE0649|nr:WYL domain-containing protein [Herbaspirillum sp. meg3]
MDEINSLPFAQQQRLRFIESMVLWEGSVQRQRVCEVFRVNPNHVTRDIQVYKKQYPKSLEYNPSLRAYEPGSKFSPHMASGDPSEYLALLYAYAESESVAMLPVLGTGGPLVDVLHAPPCKIDQYVLRTVVQAMQRGKGFTALYSSMSSDKPQTRTLWPHALLHTGIHWHVRAYDSKRDAFRNFAIQRIGKIEANDLSCPLGRDVDEEWHQQVIVEVIPNPQLNQHQQNVVANDYGMTRTSAGWVWTQQIRKCLVGYFLVHHRLDLQLSAWPNNPLSLKDPTAIEPFLFGAES